MLPSGCDDRKPVPELPEVETARRITESTLVGKTLTGVELRLPKVLRDSPIDSIDPLIGASVIGARRRAKIMIIDWDNDLSMMVHFKLAGQWAVFLQNGDRFVAGHPVPTPMGEYPHKSTHATLTFDDGTIVQYSDIRQFGWWRILPTTDVASAIEEFGYGPEATEPLDAALLAPVMARRGIPIKTLLLDQTYIAGLGNIYVDEVLWRARVHPATPANKLSAVKRNTILREIPPVIAEGIRQGGAKIVHNIAHPVDGFPAVHGRVGEPCLRCGTEIVKLRVGQRGTYICPKCQKLPQSESTGE